MICHTVLPWQFPCQFENKGAPFQILSYEWYYCVEIEVNQIPIEPGRLLQWHRYFFPWGFQMTRHHRQNLHLYLTCLYCVGWIQVEFE